MGRTIAVCKPGAARSSSLASRQAIWPVDTACSISFRSTALSTWLSGWLPSQHTSNEGMMGLNDSSARRRNVRKFACVMRCKLWSISRTSFSMKGCVSSGGMMRRDKMLGEGFRDLIKPSYYKIIQAGLTEYEKFVTKLEEAAGGGIL